MTLQDKIIITIIIIIIIHAFIAYIYIHCGSKKRANFGGL